MKSMKMNMYQKTLQSASLYLFPKKAAAKTCKLHSTINLIPHSSKILTRIILKRIRHVIKELLNKDQFGFKKEQGTREAHVVLLQVIKKQNKKRKTTFIIFVELKKVFDIIKW